MVVLDYSISLSFFVLVFTHFCILWRYLYLLKLLLAMFIFNSHSLSAISPCNITAISTHSYYLWFCHLSVSLSTQVFTFPFILRLYLCNKMAASQNGKPKDVALRLFISPLLPIFSFEKLFFVSRRRSLFHEARSNDLESSSSFDDDDDDVTWRHEWETVSSENQSKNLSSRIA